MPLIARVLLPLPLPEPFDYAVPEALEAAIQVGSQVAAPLGPRLVRGVVAELKDGAGVNRPLKPLAELLPDLAVPEKTLALTQWAARYACEAPGEAAMLALRGLSHPFPTPERRLMATGQAPKKLTPARQKVLDAIGSGEAAKAVELAERAGVSAGVIKALADEGVLVWRETPPEDPFGTPDPSLPGAALNPSQAAAANELKALIAAGGFQAALLDGVTGSGKTEVYLEAAAALLSAEPEAQVLVLLPEIALTQAVIARVAERFGAAPGEWHSGAPGPRRRQVWQGVAEGRCRIVVGARSALFLPFQTLRLIIVDEEHDASFKQEDGFNYHARDLAVVRGKLEGAAVVLASATPSLESVWNAETGRYRWLRLSARHGAARLPSVELIDLRTAELDKGRWLSRPLTEAMGETFARGEQSLLFLNRRGYAPLVLCRACGTKLTAPDTDSWLVEHRYSGRLVCHLTGWSMPKPKACPHCGAEDSLVSVGPGVERLEEEARSLFPEARVAVFSSDTAYDPAAARDLVGRMEAGEIDIMVATQAAAKGHNFPNLTLVGVVDADLGLKGGDLRAAERTYQLLAQAAGRAGRAERPGQALIQTYAPDHAVMQALAAQDRDAFLAAEQAMRELAGLPPYGRLAAVILSSPDPVALETTARAFAAAAPNAEGVEVYGPADAPLALIRGRRRKRLLAKSSRNVDLSAYMAAWRARVKIPASVRLRIDVDPYSFL
jgi:primosomal protein N' (replication factor Y) (superfamily II helicase)